MMKAKTGVIVSISGMRRVLMGTRAIMTGRRRVLGVSSQVLGGDGIVEATPKMKVCCFDGLIFEIGEDLKLVFCSDL